MLEDARLTVTEMQSACASRKYRKYNKGRVIYLTITNNNLTNYSENDIIARGWHYDIFMVGLLLK